MLKEGRTIWMNVTTSARWNRPAVGIVRTEQRLAGELEELLPAGQFRRCVWRDGCFVEWSGELLKKRAAPAPFAERDAYLIPPRRREAALTIVRNLYFLAPAMLKPLLSRVIEGTRPLLRKAASAVRAHRGRFRRPVAAAAPAPIAIGRPSAALQPQAGDVFISVGLDWEDTYYLEFAALRRRGVRVATFCHDLIPVLFPQYCIDDVAPRFTRYFLELARGSDLILCNSRQSQHDLRSLLEKHGQPQPRMTTVVLGDSLPEKDGAVSATVERLCQKRFILFVSTLDPRKNHQVLYQAYHLACEQGLRDGLPTLVFVGMLGGGMGDLMSSISLNPLTQGLIVHLDRATDAELASLYEAALFCVYPSFYEGWGLPVAEAMAFGKAVICSDRASLPEVGRDLVVYADPWNPRDWMSAILRMTTDEDFRRHWEDRVRDNYRRHAWRDTAEAVISAVAALDADSKVEPAMVAGTS